MRRKFILALILPCAALLRAGDTSALISSGQDTTLQATVVADTVADMPAAPKSLEAANDSNWWWNRLKNYNLNLADTTVRYPRFLRFCVNVYNWADRVFNSYDDRYVRGTGKRWKARIYNDNWLDSYAMDFNGNTPVWMVSEPVVNLGVNLSYMAVSLGYAIDMSNVIGNVPIYHKKFEYSFSCARFYVEGYYSSNTGGTYLRRLGDYKNRHIFKMHFSGVSFKSFGVDGYYFLNNRKYSQGAVYNFSKLQIKSAGSFIFGLTISSHDINVDFSQLPQDMQQYIGSDELKYRFRYNDYCFLLGYGYNLVFARNFVFNVTVLPSTGFKHCFAECSGGGRRDIWSLNVKGRIGVAYNLGDFFAAIVGKMDGHWFRGSRFNFFNSIETLSINAGVRF